MKGNFLGRIISKVRALKRKSEVLFENQSHLLSASQEGGPRITTLSQESLQFPASLEADSGPPGFHFFKQNIK